MMDIQTQMTVEQVMDELLKEYAAVPPENYKKQLRIQIRNEAAQDENFARAFEMGVADYFSSAPRLDEIEDYLNEMDPAVEELLDYHGILDRARRIAKGK